MTPEAARAVPRPNRSGLPVDPPGIPGIRPVSEVRRLRGILAVALLAVLAASCSTKPKEPEEILTRRKQADSLMMQGHARTDELAFDAARTSYDAALGIYASLDYRPGTVSALLALGRNRRMTGDAEAAGELFDHAEAMASEIEEPRIMRDVLNHKADLALRTGDPVAAAAFLEEGTETEGGTAPAVTDGRERAAQLRLRGSALYAMGKADEAKRLLAESAVVAEAADEKVEAAQSYYKLASVASLDARFDEAVSWASKALESDKAAEYRPGIAADLRALAIISSKAGDQAAAENYFRRSWLAWRGLGREGDAEEARTELENLTGRPVTAP